MIYLHKTTWFNQPSRLVAATALVHTITVKPLIRYPQPTHAQHTQTPPTGCGLYSSSTSSTAPGGIAADAWIVTVRTLGGDSGFGSGLTLSAMMFASLAGELGGVTTSVSVFSSSQNSSAARKVYGGVGNGAVNFCGIRNSYRGNNYVQ